MARRLHGARLVIASHNAGKVREIAELVAPFGVEVTSAGELGLAEPEALPRALAAWQAYERLGSPEGEVAIANLVIYLATAPKSNTAYQAFKAAGRPTPLIIMGNRHDELTWWKEQKDANGYETMSVSIAPGVSTLAFWVAQMILDGQDVPKDLVVPFLRIDQDNLEQNLANTEKGGVANVEYSLEDAKKVVAGK